MSAIRAQSRKPAWVATSMLSSSARASEGSSTGVCPDVTTCRGPRTVCVGLTGTTWPLTSQSNKCRSAASRCLTEGAASSRVAASIQVATCTGWTAPIAGTPALAHQARNSSAARAYARRVCGLRMLAAKNSRKAHPGALAGRGDESRECSRPGDRNELTHA
jgi:hypothetical protein